MTYEVIFTALSDPTRRRIFELVAESPASVGSVAKKIPVSRPAVSQHLRILSDAGLVSARAEGTRRIYSASPEKLAELRTWLDGLWGGAMQSFAEAAKKERIE